MFAAKSGNIEIVYQLLNYNNNNNDCDKIDIDAISVNGKLLQALLYF